MRKSSLIPSVGALLFVAIFIQSVAGFNVRLSYRSASPGVIDFERTGYCTDSDAASHTFMPTTSSFNSRAKETLNSGGGKQAAMGGFSRKAICLDKQCNWQYYKGLYTDNELTFYSGVYYDGTLKYDPSFTSFYVGWEAQYPKWWSNISYWGARQVAMQSSGTWMNVDVVTYFTDWVCEIYEYQKSDSVFFPTWANGDPILPTASGQSAYSHCGKTISVDSRGRLVDVQCSKKFPWWAGLVIAVVCLIIVVGVIILVWCCCCICNRRDEENDRRQKILTTRDNPASIPYQSELGMSRASSSRYMDDEDDDDERSFSRSDSNV